MINSPRYFEKNLTWSSTISLQVAQDRSGLWAQWWTSLGIQYIFLLVWFWCSGTGKGIWTHKGTDKLSWTQRGSNSQPPDWGNTTSCQLSSTSTSCHWNCVKNTIPMTCPRLHWTTDHLSGMHRCQFQHLCVLILICALASGQTILLNDRSDRSKPLRSIIDRKANLRSIICRFFIIVKWIGLLLWKQYIIITVRLAIWDNSHLL